MHKEQQIFTKKGDSVYLTPTLKWHNVPNVLGNTIPKGWRKLGKM
jgi:hypothetical protein